MQAKIKTIEIDGDNTLYVNGEPLTRNWSQHIDRHGRYTFEFDGHCVSTKNVVETAGGMMALFVPRIQIHRARLTRVMPERLRMALARARTR